MSDLQLEAAKTGLSIHFSKTKVLSNGIGRQPQVKQLHIEGGTVQISGNDESSMYLGRELNLTDYHQTELKHRIARAWGKFAQLKPQFADKHIPDDRKAKLFEATVTQTFLFGCEAWTLTSAMASDIQTVQNKMMRVLFGKQRQLQITADGPQLENWVAWVKRVTP